MRAPTSLRSWFAALLVVAPFGTARGDEPSAATKPARPVADDPGISVLDAVRNGSAAVEAEGTGDGRMTIKVSNLTNRKLKIVLPPGLVASNAAGQMGGGMGGMGGGMGGMGGGGGGMGGGMGGGGGMQGGGMRQLTLPATQGMMMLGRLIMTLVEPTESWNPASLMSGMMGMGGGGMGGMGGGGMGGMGGGGMGGGGFRSIPPTDLPNATLAPGQTRSLSTRFVSLNPPGPDGTVAPPAKGEKLEIGDVSQLPDVSPRVQSALRRLARDKAPESVSQLALWGVAGMDWADVARASRGWAHPANAQEIALARQLAADLDSDRAADAGRLMIEVDAAEAGDPALADRLRALLGGRTMLGLSVEAAVPARPAGPAVACKVRLAGPEASVSVATSDAAGSAWAPAGKFTLPMALDEAGQPKLEPFGDALAEELLKRLVKVTLSRPKAGAREAKDRETYTLRVENYSPLMLNGIALAGVGSKPSEPAKALLGIALAPRRTLAFPADATSVERLGMKDGVRVLALDLSGL